MANPDAHAAQVPAKALQPAGPARPESGPESEYARGGEVLQKGVFVTPANFCEAHAFTAGSLASLPKFRRFVDNLKGIGARSVYLYPTDSGRAIWPSAWLRSMDVDLLQEFCGAMHAQGLEVHIYYLERDPYFGPTEAYRTPIECLWDLQEKWANVLDEIVDRDIDGLCVPPDEYWWPVHMGLPGPDDPCTKKFREWFGQDPPPELGDQPAGYDRQPVLRDAPVGRDWIEYGYRAVTEIYAGWNERVKQRNPKVVRTNILQISHIASNRRTNVDYAQVGHATDWSSLMTDPYVSLHTRLKDRFYVPETVKHLIAGTPNRRAEVTLQNARLEKREPVELRAVDVFGSAVSALANGAIGVYFFHYTYLFDRKTAEPAPGHHGHTAHAFSLMRTLDRWDILQATVPGEVVLLHSRRSQDYAGLRASSALGNGYDAHEAACDLLFSEGYPFQLYYLEQADGWASLPDARAIIVPFGYALSDAEVAQLEAYARAGKHILVLQRAGEADERGEPRETPALAALAEAHPERVTRIDGDLPFRQADPAYRRFFYDALNGALGDHRLLTLERRGADVEVTALRLPEGGLLVFLINWESRPIAFELGVNVPGGHYRVTRRTHEGLQPLGLAGSATVSAEAMAALSVALEPEAAEIWHVAPAS